MTPKLSNLDIPEIKAAAAEWALVSSQIEKITLHCFKPGRISTPDKGPFYAIIIWVSPEVDVTITTWEELVKAPDGKAPRAHVREQYKGQDGNNDIEIIEKHPLHDLWKLFDNLSDPIGRGYFDSFYRDGFERSDPRFDWIVLLLNIGAESLFEQGEEHDDLDSTEVGSAVLFSRNAEAQQVNATPAQIPISVESCTPKMKRWIHGWELRERWVPWNVNHYDIVSMILNGELTAHNTRDQTPIDVDIEKPLRENIKFLANKIGVMGMALGGKNLESYRKDIKDDLTRSITLGLDGFLFKMVEVEEYERTHGLIPQNPQTEPVDLSTIPNSSTPDSAASPEQIDPEAFIRSLQVFHVDNTTIKIQYKRKSTDYTCKSIGFRDSKTKAWVTFLEILQSKDHFYKLGPANYYDEGLRKKVPVKEYSRRKALLKEIKKKLLYFLSKQYGVVFPPRVKLYELQPTQGDGVYLFLFQIPLDKPSYKTKDQALRLLETLIQEEASTEKIQQATETAMDAGATQDEVFEIVKDRLTSPQKYSETADEPEDGDEDKEE